MSQAIVVTDLVKKYKSGETNAVDGISFDVQKGEFFTLLGPNGAGKTTTISILTTTLSKTSGDIKINGFDTETDSQNVRQDIGIIFQQPSLDENLTAEENVRFHVILYGLFPARPTFGSMPKAYKEKIAELAEILGIQDEMYKPIRTFSGGMKRKLEIIRGLMHEPTILFLDEPTTGLDPASRKTLWSYLQKIRKEQNITIFLTTHYLEEAEGSDRVCIMNRGKIVMLGTPKDIKQRLVRHYLELVPHDIEQLDQELTTLNMDHSVEKDVVCVSLENHSVQEIIQKVQTPLAHIITHTPSLEDAYLSIIDEQYE